MLFFNNTSARALARTIRKGSLFGDNFKIENRKTAHLVRNQKHRSQCGKTNVALSAEPNIALSAETKNIALGAENKSLS